MSKSFLLFERNLSLSFVSHGLNGVSLTPRPVKWYSKAGNRL